MQFENIERRWLKWYYWQPFYTILCFLDNLNYSHLVKMVNRLRLLCYWSSEKLGTCEKREKCEANHVTNQTTMWRSEESRDTHGWDFWCCASSFNFRNKVRISNSPFIITPPLCYNELSTLDVACYLFDKMPGWNSSLGWFTMTN
jgi:hypothetical protein